MFFGTGTELDEVATGFDVSASDWLTNIAEVLFAVSPVGLVSVTEAAVSVLESKPPSSSVSGLLVSREPVFELSHTEGLPADGLATEFGEVR